MAKGIYHYLRNAWKKPDIKTLRERMIRWRTENVVIKVDKPTRLDRARSLGYKAKKGYIIFILDASGSMWGQVQGGTKIGIAKNVLTDLIKNIPDGLNVALVVYGQRRKGDCSDVEENPLQPSVLDRLRFLRESVLRVIAIVGPGGQARRVRHRA